MCENIGFYISQTSQGQQIGKKGLKGLFLVVDLEKFVICKILGFHTC